MVGCNGYYSTRSPQRCSLKRCLDTESRDHSAPQRVGARPTPCHESAAGQSVLAILPGFLPDTKIDVKNPPRCLFEERNK